MPPEPYKKMIAGYLPDFAGSKSSKEIVLSPLLKFALELLTSRVSLLSSSLEAKPGPPGICCLNHPSLADCPNGFDRFVCSRACRSRNFPWLAAAQIKNIVQIVRTDFFMLT